MKIGVIGLGYVGLPVAHAFSKKFEVYGFDVNEIRVQELSEGNDRTKELTSKDLKNKNLKFSSEISSLKDCSFFIIAVPTPIDHANIPNLNYLKSASELLGSVLKKGDTVVYESTVYPGATEEECIPVLEKYSGLKFQKDFYVGYSPERINPGDKEHTITKIKKVVSGCCEKSLKLISKTYGEIIEAGVFEAASIKVAEAAKVIENTQRDLNIALMNELAMIFDRLDIDTEDVLNVASTKWNFLKFKPGLVGGHCIGVDPFYLTYKAGQVNYHPEIILAGRKINDEMGRYIAQRTIKKLIKTDFVIKDSSVLILGATFKENCPDLRNSKIKDIFHELNVYGVKTKVYDPVCLYEELKDIYQDSAINKLDEQYEAIIVGVGHDQFLELDLNQYLKNDGVLIDVKSFLDQTKYKNENFWRL